ncbi:hypothetical protein ACE2AJ_00560 [Aquihabitans daechungensis]|uniref:hypothetical protein n=1 Tax=Aquihabitans daechungensis TaxID=1052257 RepID=UPI003BA1D07B
MTSFELGCDLAGPSGPLQVSLTAEQIQRYVVMTTTGAEEEPAPDELLGPEREVRAVEEWQRPGSGWGVLVEDLDAVPTAAEELHCDAPARGVVDRALLRASPRGVGPPRELRWQHLGNWHGLRDRRREGAEVPDSDG